MSASESISGDFLFHEVVEEIMEVTQTLPQKASPVSGS